MFKKYLTLTLAVLVINLSLGVSVFAQTDREARRVEKVKADVAKLAGENAPMAVRLKNGAKFKGKVSEVSDAGFVLTNAKTSAATNLLYADVRTVGRTNLSGGASFAALTGIIIGVTVVGLLIIGYAARSE